MSETSAAEAEVRKWREALRASPRDADAVVRLRNAAVRWALALEAAGDDPAAIAAWREAEERQWQVGTWSSAAAEGLASMCCVYELMLRRAAAEDRLAARATGEAAEAHRRTAAELLAKIAADPNRLGPDILGDRYLGANAELGLPPAPRPKWPR